MALCLFPVNSLCRSSFPNSFSSEQERDGGAPSHCADRTEESTGFVPCPSLGHGKLRETRTRVSRPQAGVSHPSPRPRSSSDLGVRLALIEHLQFSRHCAQRWARLRWRKTLCWASRGTPLLPPTPERETSLKWVMTVQSKCAVKEGRVTRMLVRGLISGCVW